MIRATCTGSDVIGADAVVAPEEVVRVPLPLGVQQAVVVAGVPPKLNLPILHVLGRLVKVAALSYFGQGVSQLFVMKDRDRDITLYGCCLLYTSPSPRDMYKSRMPSSA